MNGSSIKLEVKEGGAREVLLRRLEQISTRLPEPEPLEADAAADGSIVPLIGQQKVA